MGALAGVTPVSDEARGGSETPIRSRGGAVLLVDQPADEVPAANISGTD